MSSVLSFNCQEMDSGIFLKLYREQSEFRKIHAIAGCTALGRRVAETSYDEVSRFQIGAKNYAKLAKSQRLREFNVLAKLMCRT